MYYVVYVAPEIVVFCDMSFEATLRVPVECESVVVADKAYVHHVVIYELLIFSELGKSVDDDTEENVKKDELNQD